VIPITETMRTAIGLSLLTHRAFGTMIALISLHSNGAELVGEIYSVRLLEFPTVAELKVPDVIDQVRRTEPVKPMPPVEVERIKARKERVDVKGSRAVEVAKKTGLATKEGRKSGIGGLRVEGKEFGYPYYFEIVRRRLQMNFHNPYVTAGGAIVKTTIFFQITTSGRIINTRVEKTSGYPAFDQAARRAVLASNPFPSLPEPYQGDVLGVHCDFLSARE